MSDHSLLSAAEIRASIVRREASGLALHARRIGKAARACGLDETCPSRVEGELRRAVAALRSEADWLESVADEIAAARCAKETA